jgi:hypothetical protein
MRKVMCLFEETTPARGEKMMTPWSCSRAPPACHGYIVTGSQLQYLKWCVID